MTTDNSNNDTTAPNEPTRYDDEPTREPAQRPRVDPTKGRGVTRVSLGDDGRPQVQNMRSQLNQNDADPTRLSGGRTFARDVLPTARRGGVGGPVGQVNDDTIVSIGRIEDTIGGWIQSGMIVKGSDGSYRMAGEAIGGDTATPGKVAPSANDPNGSDAGERVTLATDPDLDAYNLSDLTAAVGDVLAGGDLRPETIDNLAVASGENRDAIRTKVGEAFDRYDKAARDAIEATGIDPDHVFESADKAELSRAVRDHVLRGDLNGYREIGLKALTKSVRTNPEDVVKANPDAGLEIVRHGNSKQVVVTLSDGDKMDLLTAVRYGLVSFGGK